MITQTTFFPANEDHAQVEESSVVLVVKNPPANAGDLRDMGWIPHWK